MKKSYCIIITCIFVSSVRGQELILSIPKSGTHLLGKCIELITGKRHKINVNDAIKTGQLHSKQYYLWGHMWSGSQSDRGSMGPTPEKIKFITENDIRTIVIFRNPADLICSLITGINKAITEETITQALQHLGPLFHRLTKSACYKRYDALAQTYAEQLLWCDYPQVYITTFEKLVGQHGGGNDKVQMQEIIHIANHIGYPITQARARYIARKVFGRTKTFKKGQIGTWKKHFSLSIKLLLDQQLIPLSYIEAYRDLFQLNTIDQV